MCLSKGLARWFPFWGRFMTPNLGPKKCPHTVGGPLFGPKFGTIFGTQNGGQIWYPKRGPHMVPKNKVSAAVF
jgi:hypothetical protein